MLCPHCQQETSPGSAFCGNCGQPLAAAAPAPAPAPAPPAGGPPASGPPAAVPVSPQPPSVLAAGLQHAASTPAAPLPMGSPGMMTGGTMAMPMQRTANTHSGLAVASLILGVTGFIGSLIPIVGLILGILSIIFGTMSLKSTRRGLALAGTILGALTIIASMGVFAYNYNKYQSEHLHTANGVSSGTTTLGDIDTPCFSTKIGENATTTTLPLNECTVSVDGNESGDLYIIGFDYGVGLTASNLAASAHADMKKVLEQYEGSAIKSEKSTSFKGNNAYELDIASATGKKGKAIYVLNSSQAAYNYFFIVRFARGDSTSLQTVEDNWQWK